MSKNHEELGTANHNGLLLKLSTPSMLALFTNALHNITDTIFVGRGVGTECIAMMWLMGISHATMGAHQAMRKAKSAFPLAALLVAIISMIFLYVTFRKQKVI